MIHRTCLTGTPGVWLTTPMEYENHGLILILKGNK